MFPICLGELTYYNLGVIGDRISWASSILYNTYTISHILKHITRSTYSMLKRGFTPTLFYGDLNNIVKL